MVTQQAEAAFDNIRQKEGDQSVVISGESGSGKVTLSPSIPLSLSLSLSISLLCFHSTYLYLSLFSLFLSFSLSLSLSLSIYISSLVWWAVHSHRCSPHQTESTKLILQYLTAVTTNPVWIEQPVSSCLHL